MGRQGQRAISFGALAKAQSLLDGLSKRRKQHGGDAVSGAEADPEEAHGQSRSLKSSDLPLSKRTSKHGPTVRSSRHAVSRRRDIFDPSPTSKSRDPRFDASVSGLSYSTGAEKVNKNYAFLSEYQASEILDLKAQIRKAKDPEVRDVMKRQLMSLDSKIRAVEVRQRKDEIIKRHKESEKVAIQRGQKSKPYFLKKSDIKHEISKQRFDGMSKKARNKSMERKRKRVKGKESKGMPRARRELPS